MSWAGMALAYEQGIQGGAPGKVRGHSRYEARFESGRGFWTGRNGISEASSGERGVTRL